MWYVLFGLGCGLAVPLIASAAMADIPRGISGVASGILNASRQAGTSVGLAVIGSVGVSVTTSAWDARIPALTNRAASQALTRAISGGQLQLVRQQLGLNGAQQAITSFTHGYNTAVTAAAVILLAAAAIAYADFPALRIALAGDRASTLGAEPTTSSSSDADAPTRP